MSQCVQRFISNVKPALDLPHACAVANVYVYVCNMCDYARGYLNCAFQHDI